MTLFPSCSEVTTDSCLASCLRSDSFSALNGESSGLQPLAKTQSAITAETLMSNAGTRHWFKRVLSRKVHPSI